MPRARGNGGVGAAGNRTDRPGALPANVVPSKQYGQATEELAQQHALPMASGEIAPSGSAPAPGGAPIAPTMPGPGEVTPLDAPTGRPDEPLTHGLPTGPGGGPEVLQPPNPLIKTAAILNQLGDEADAPTRRLRAIINAQLNNNGAE